MESIDIWAFLSQMHYFVIYIVVLIFLIKYHRQTKLLMQAIIALVIMAIAKFGITTIRAFDEFLYQRQYVFGYYDYDRFMMLVYNLDGLAQFLIFVLLFWQIFKLAKKVVSSKEPAVIQESESSSQ